MNWENTWVNLDLLTDETYEMIEKQFNLSKEQITNIENDPELREKVFMWALMLECDSIENGVDKETQKLGELGEKISDALLQREPDPDFCKDCDEE